MDSNYKWQEHRAKERAEARLQEAAAHRMLRGDAQQREFFLIRAWRRMQSIVVLGRRAQEPSTRATRRTPRPRLAGDE